MTTRQDKVNSLVQRQIADYLLREELEAIKGLVTIASVEVTADMRHAKVFFSVVGQDEDEVAKSLHSRIYQIQGMLHKKLRMKIVPRISFVADRSGAYAQHISRVIRDLKKHENKART